MTAVCDLSLEVATGQIYSLVGTNGAGKTWTIKALAGILSDGKTIIISSYILTELSDFCNAIGIMEKGRMKEIVLRLANVFNVSDKLRKNFLNVLGESFFIASPQEVKTGEFHALFFGEEKDAVHLLNQLVKKDFSILEFHIKEANVEDIFLKVGDREVS